MVYYSPEAREETPLSFKRFGYLFNAPSWALKIKQTPGASIRSFTVFRCLENTIKLVLLSVIILIKIIEAVFAKIWVNAEGSLPNDVGRSETSLLFYVPFFGRR